MTRADIRNKASDPLTCTPAGSKGVRLAAQIRQALEAGLDLATRARLAQQIRTVPGLQPLSVTIEGLGQLGTLLDALTVEAACDGWAVHEAGMTETPDLHLIALTAAEPVAPGQFRGRHLSLVAPLPNRATDKALAGVEILDTAAMAGEAGGWIDPRRMGEALPFLTPRAAAGLARAVLAAHRRVTHRQLKLILTDLDGTLWGGVLAEDGPDGLVMDGRFAAYQRALGALRARGMHLAIVSRNEAADVMAVLESHPSLALGPAAFAAIEAGWEPKAAMVRRVLTRLGVAPEAAAMIDDDPLERALLVEALPAMKVTGSAGPEVALAALDQAGRLPKRVTSEDAGRHRSTQSGLRLQTDLEAGADRETIMAGLGMRVRFVDLSAETLPRAMQLSHRVTQFRTTAQTLDPNVLAVPWPRVFLTHMTDRYGDHGRIGLVVWTLRGTRAEIELLCLSCRALTRDIETAMLAETAARAQAAGARWLSGMIETLARNAPARPLFIQHGFTKRGALFELDLDCSPLTMPAHLRRVDRIVTP